MRTLRGNVFSESLPSNGYTRHHMILLWIVVAIIIVSESNYNTYFTDSYLLSCIYSVSSQFVIVSVIINRILFV
jgi:hypothetical protein